MSDEDDDEVEEQYYETRVLFKERVINITTARVRIKAHSEEEAIEKLCDMIAEGSKEVEWDSDSDEGDIELPGECEAKVSDNQNEK